MRLASAGAVTVDNVQRILSLLLVTAVIGSACASGGSTNVAALAEVEQPAVAADTAAREAETESTPATVATAEEGTAMAASSPIGAFFADDGGFEAAIAEYRLQVRESILRCMAAQGFEFDATAANNRNEVEERQNDMTIREWTSEFGFGISTSFDSIAQSRATNPNGAIFRSLSPAEQELWALTLNGVGVSGLGGGGDQVSNTRPLQDQGCIGQALLETGGEEAIEGLGNFGDVYDEGEAALLERREVVEVVAVWSRCMSEAGFAEFAGLDDPEEEVRTRFQEITAPIGPALAELSDEEGQALLSGESLDVEKLPGLDVEALREIQAYERELALADLDCYEAEVQAVYEPLRDEFENGLLEEFATEFAAVKNLGS